MNLEALHKYVWEVRSVVFVGFSHHQQTNIILEIHET